MMLEIRHLCKKYEVDMPLKDVNAVVNKGDIIAVIGPSGTGKSTLLRCINGLEKSTGGEILFNGENILGPDCDMTSVRRKIGMVFQNFNLFSHLNIAENIMLGPCRINGIGRQEAFENAVELLTRVGLKDKVFAYPEELSGGQKQRVAIARTLAMNPEMILFDEPTSALDPSTVGEVKSVIFSLAKQGMTMMIVTHDMEFARTVSNRVFYMDQGLVYEEGSPEKIFSHPEKERTIQFIQRLSVFKRDYEGREFDFPELMAQIEDFCHKILINSSKIFLLQLAVEELIMNRLLPAAKEGFLWKIYIKGKEGEPHPVITLKYNDKIDELPSDDELSSMLIKGVVTDIQYNRVRDGEYTNELVTTLK